MKTGVPLSVLLLLFLISPVVLAQDGASGDEVLTNDKVITLVKAALPPSLIVAKIRASKTNFNTNTDELIRLQQAHVPTEVISAMVDSAGNVSTIRASTGAGDAAKSDPHDPLSAHEAGIYLLEERDGRRYMTQLEPSVSSQSKSGGFFTSALTGGLTKIKSKAVLASPNARLQLNNSKPVFYFYFEVKNAGLSNSGNAYGSSSSSPNEFVLVQMDGKKNGRELVVGQFSAFGAQSGTLDKYSRAFDFEKVAPGVYKVTPRADLGDGEYGFFYGGSTPIAGYGYFGAGMSPKIFDFGIKVPR